ncbi:MAG: hypothetical protein HY080_10830 [Gammaproteobacteria bacterium]|nr:hypothetical protein [Gammaproteobacteria bacterium]
MQNLVRTHFSLFSKFTLVGVLVVFTLLPTYAYPADAVKLKPFILAAASNSGVDINTTLQTVTKKLTDGGFQIVGEYSPYNTTTIIVVTNDALRSQAALSSKGAFGAIQRVTITQVGNEIQVAYTNPVYMAQVYRMKTDLTDVKDKLAAALGNAGEYGPEEGLTKEDLRDYHYKFLMPYFTDTLELAAYSDYKTALDKVEAGLATGIGGVKKIYRVDLPGKDETVIGVGMSGPNDDCSGDAYIMSRIDFKKVKSTGHLPYEVVISKGKVYTLPAEFRIAINFPDLSMMGSNSFASIMCAPNSIKTVLTKAVGGKLE